MTTVFTGETFVKDIVTKLPKSSDIFKQYRIDFCCGGKRPLEEAAAERNLEVESILSEIHALYEKEKEVNRTEGDWTNASITELISHIQSQYHRPLEEELSLLSPYVTKVAKVHGERKPELIKMFELYSELRKELLEHTKKEDEVVFPLMMALENQSEEERKVTIEKIHELEDEHDSAGAILKELREVTKDFTPPIDACGTYQLVYKRLEMLEGQTFMHIHLENNILFQKIN